MRSLQKLLLFSQKEETRVATNHHRTEDSGMLGSNMLSSDHKKGSKY